LYPDAITIFNDHRYDAGFYPDCKNYVDVAYCHTLKDGSGYPAITIDDLWNFYFRDRWPNTIGKKCYFVYKDNKRIKQSPDIEAYYIYDNEYTTIKSDEHVEVYIHWMMPLGRKIAMLFYKYSGDSNYKLKMVTIEQYTDMVKCR
jgi:hypothetical protein